MARRRASRAPQPAELADHDQVLAAGESVVEGRVLAGHADLAPHGGGLRDHVVAGHPRLPAVGRCERREDAHAGRLAGPVGAQHAEDGAGADLQIDLVERLSLAVALRQSRGFDHDICRSFVLLPVA